MLSLPQEGQKVLGLNLNRSESNARAIGPNDSILQAAASLLHCGISAHSMSALGQKQTSRPAWTLSASPPKADIGLTPAAASRPQLWLPWRFETRQLTTI
jgi:hypothetical protein